MAEATQTKLLQCFSGRAVVVDTAVGAFAGILRRAERSAHMGIGNLLLDSGGSWLLVKAWIAIKSVNSKKRDSRRGEAVAQIS